MGDGGGGSGTGVAAASVSIGSGTAEEHGGDGDSSGQRWGRCGCERCPPGGADQTGGVAYAGAPVPEARATEAPSVESWAEAAEHSTSGLKAGNGGAGGVVGGSTGGGVGGAVVAAVCSVTSPFTAAGS
ncbi:PE-PGRS family protein PE_PGRS47-like [Schistocerca nitens]|uniref:PE-PGRS family protein PE_PGRS47-like n=1 Tax=Schistocerca nitens TaxID=7011 RepID=UPI002117F871|nr:PE-PGRS family protein PE_PGRS47-like [Schistocerca nitens]